jgi:hypothetical protein
MTIAELRQAHDHFCATMEMALANARRQLRELQDGDDDPRPPSRPGAALNYEPYPGKKLRRAQHPRTRGGLEYAEAVMPEVEYSASGRISRVR